jgi:hypothetical protein
MKLRYEIIFREGYKYWTEHYIVLYAPRCMSAKFRGTVAYKDYKSAERAAKRMGFEPREEKK